MFKVRTGTIKYIFSMFKVRTGTIKYILFCSSISPEKHLVDFRAIIVIIVNTVLQAQHKG